MARGTTFDFSNLGLIDRLWVCWRILGGRTFRLWGVEDSDKQSQAMETQSQVAA